MATITSEDKPLLEAPLPREILSDLYTNMIKARTFDRRSRAAQTMSEAILSATVANAEPADFFVTAGEQPVLAALTGTPISAFSDKAKDRKPDETSSNSRLTSVGAEAAAGIACGLALARKHATAQAIVIGLFPSKFTNGSAWAQATEFAASQRLPLVFISDGTSSRSPRKHDGHALSHWPLPTIAVDGRDVIAVYRVTKEAISAARRGHGPTLVDCVNFVAPGRRGKDQRDPIASFRGYLKRHNAWDEETYKALERDLAREIAAE